MKDKPQISGDDNILVNGAHNHLGDKNIDITNNINELNIHNYDLKETKGVSSRKKEISEFFEIAVQKTPFLDAMTFYFGGAIVFFTMMLLLDFKNYTFIVVILEIIGLYMLNSWLSNKFVPLIYIMEDKFKVSYLDKTKDHEYLYKDIRLDDTKSTGSTIDIKFNNGDDPIYYNFYRDRAGLLEHKIREYHRMMR